MTVEEEALSCEQQDMHSSEEHNGCDSHSFLPLPNKQSTDDMAIRNTILGDTLDPLNWPDINNVPINEFQTPYLATMSFPTLFPYATGDPTYPGRQRPVSLIDGFKHLIKYGDISDSNIKSWRFASHPRFIYWALNMKQRHQLLSQAKIYLLQNPGDANLSVDDLKTMVGTTSADYLMKRLQRYAAKIQGSNGYWFQRHQELQALLEQKGPPTFFWTVSSADTYWPELHSLLPHSTDNPSPSMHCQAVISNPHITDWYFTSKLTDFVEHWLYDTLDAEWHWYCLEYQSRGSTHAHGCAKLKNDVGICALVQKAASGWLADKQLQTGDVDTATHQTLLCAIEEGLKAKEEVLQYVDWLVNTCNDSIPDTSWSLSNPHPCAINITNVTDMDTDYQDLVNSIQRYTRCSAAYCLHKKHSETEQQCRFKYPCPLQEVSTLEFEQLDNGDICATISTKQNDERINSHSHIMLQHWRANVDLQIIVDAKLCSRYMAKYAAKGESHSKSLTEIFNSCIHNLNTDSGDVHKALRSAMLRGFAERDFSSQETTHMI